MKESIIYNLLRFVIIFLIIALILTFFLICNHYAYKRWEKTYNVEKSNIERDYAISELGALRGKVEIIKKFYTDYLISENVEDDEEFFSKEAYYLKQQLKAIADYKPLLPNQYLDNLNFTITETKIGDICEELFSQIDNEIHSIRYGKEE